MVIHRKVNHAAAELEQRLTGIAVAFVLLDGVLPPLAGAVSTMSPTGPVTKPSVPVMWRIIRLSSPFSVVSVFIANYSKCVARKSERRTYPRVPSTFCTKPAFAILLNVFLTFR
jgi:hypothetical protein